MPFYESRDISGRKEGRPLGSFGTPFPQKLPKDRLVTDSGLACEPALLGQVPAEVSLCLLRLPEDRGDDAWPGGYSVHLAQQRKKSAERRSVGPDRATIPRAKPLVPLDQRLIEIIEP